MVLRGGLRGFRVDFWADLLGEVIRTSGQISGGCLGRSLEDLLGEVLMVSGQISWGDFLESTPKLEDGRNFIRYLFRVDHGW